MCRMICREPERIVVRYIPMTVKVADLMKSEQNENADERLDTLVAHVRTPIAMDGNTTLSTGKEHSAVEGVTNSAFFEENIFDKKVHVLILASFRGGSTFVGELFNANDDFFYSYEPGRTLLKCMQMSNLPYSLVRPKHVEMLNDIFRCNFTSDLMRCYASDLAKSPLRKRTREIPLLTPSILCSDRWPQFIPPSKQCATVKTDILHDLCRERKHVVIKSIRLYDLNDIVTLLHDPSLNVKVIHVIRDPRGKAPSWMERRLVSKSNYTLADLKEKVIVNMKRYCGYALDNLLIGLAMRNWLKNRYKAVKYEDIALNPLEMTQDIYNFVGLPVPDSVVSWVQNNTKYNDGGPFDTTRNSAEAALAWKRTLSPDAIERIQELSPCKEFMLIAGYMPVYSMGELNDKNNTFLDSFPTQYIPNLKYKEDQYSSLFWTP
ncbi:carbohydrate sulfotransferase 1-like [Glandiceps talaboti]